MSDRNLKGKNEVKSMIGEFGKYLLVGIVFAFFTLESWNFFTFIFTGTRWYYAFLGYGLTGFGAVIYFVAIKTASTSMTPVRKIVSLVMLIVCMFGELLTAGYGMTISNWKAQGRGIVFDTDFMILSIQVLGFCHALALILYYLYDEIHDMFGDEDGDGVKNYRDPDWRGKQPKPVHVLASDTEQVREPVFTPAGGKENHRSQK